MPKNALFLLKNRKNRRAGASSPDPLAPASGGFSPPASSGWMRLRPQTPIGFQSLEALLPYPRIRPHDEFLATRLLLTRLLIRSVCQFDTTSLLQAQLF